FSEKTDQEPREELQGAQEVISLKIGQEKFLGNSKNKSRLINMLKKKLSENNIFACQGEVDADILRVQTAINTGPKNVVVSENIDVLALITALNEFSAKKLQDLNSLEYSSFIKAITKK
ncbi:hypothetical protein ILUMI_24105, partial [Ignelater luminosus]